MSDEQKDISEISSLLSSGDIDSLTTKLAELKPADIADLIENLEDRVQRNEIFDILNGETRSEVLILLERVLSSN